MNEQAAIETTLASIFALDYPQHLLSVFAVDDGSTDATWERMAFAARRFPNLHAIRFSHNRGKRAAMAAGIRATDARSSASSTPTRRSSPTRCARSSSRSATAAWPP